MALPILDGNQTSTTLATTVSGGAHYPNHIIDSGTVTANVAGINVNNGLPVPIPIASGNDAFAEEGPRLGVQLLGRDGLEVGQGSSCVLPISGTVTANVGFGEPFYWVTALGGDTIDGLFERQGKDIWSSKIGSISLFYNTDAFRWELYFDQILAGYNGAYDSIPPEAGWVTQGDYTSISVTRIKTPISGTVTANLPNSSLNPLGVSIWNDSNQLVGADVPMVVGGVVTIAGSTEFRFLQVSTQGSASVFGTVTVGNSVTVSSLPAISGTVTANVPLVSNLPTTQQALPVVLITDEGKSVFEVNQAIKSTLVTALPSGTNRIGVVTVSSLPSGALTTRFGSVTTANTAQLTAAVTNSARRYLLCQNLDPSVTVTIGIGFTPTTTQGIQLAAGGGIIMDSFVSTGAVWWLSSSAGSNFSILEG